METEQTDHSLLGAKACQTQLGLGSRLLGGGGGAAGAPKAQERAGSLSAAHHARYNLD